MWSHHVCALTRWLRSVRHLSLLVPASEQAGYRILQPWTEKQLDCCFRKCVHKLILIDCDKAKQTALTVSEGISHILSNQMRLFSRAIWMVFEQVEIWLIILKRCISICCAFLLHFWLRSPVYPKTCCCY